MVGSNISQRPRFYMYSCSELRPCQTAIVSLLLPAGVCCFLLLPAAACLCWLLADVGFCCLPLTAAYSCCLLLPGVRA